MVYIVAIDDDVVVRLENDQASFYCVFCFKLLSNLSVCMAVCVCVCVCVCVVVCMWVFFLRQQLQQTHLRHFHCPQEGCSYSSASERWFATLEQLKNVSGLNKYKMGREKGWCHAR